MSASSSNTVHVPIFQWPLLDHPVHKSPEDYEHRHLYDLQSSTTRFTNRLEHFMRHLRQTADDMDFVLLPLEGQEEFARSVNSSKLAVQEEGQQLIGLLDAFLKGVGNMNVPAFLKDAIKKG